VGAQAHQAGELKVLQMDVQTYFFRRTNMNALGKPRSWTDHLLWHHACHTVDLFAYQTGQSSRSATRCRGRLTRTQDRDGHEHRHAGAVGRHLHAVAVVQQRRPARHVLPLHLRQRHLHRALRRAVDGKNNPIDVSKVDVSMNGIELQDREFFAAIKEGREPNASVGRCCRRCGRWGNWK
jgi:2-hydroxy-4-carboxymuconate semialdehyde hemiacetal dehydrogenase